MYSLGCLSAGSCDHFAYTALKSAAPASSARCLSTRNEIQLGRYEYWIVTSAVSPCHRYSSEFDDCGSIQPVPVVPMTTSTSRDQASVRSSSLTASLARSSAVGALSTPTYTRMGSSAGSPVNSWMAAASGPRPVKLRPCRPSESHVTSDPGPPERSELVGSVAPCAVVSLVLPYTLSARFVTWLHRMLTMMITGTAITRKPSATDAHPGSRRPKRLPAPRASRCSRRASIRIANQMTSAMGTASSGVHTEPGSSVMSSRVWLFQTPPT